MVRGVRSEQWFGGGLAGSEMGSWFCRQDWRDMWRNGFDLALVYTTVLGT